MEFKELSAKGKLEHIWEYYKLRIFMICFLVIAGISIIYTVFIKPHPNNYCGIAMYDQFLSIDDDENLTNELNSLLNLDNKEYTVEIESFYTDDTDVMVEAELNQKFNTYLYAAQFHMIMADEQAMSDFVAMGFVAPLTDYLTDEEIKTFENKGLVKSGTDPATNQIAPMAIKLNSSALLNKYRLYENRECYIGFVPMPEEYNDSTVKTFMELTK